MGILKDRVRLLLAVAAVLMGHFLVVPSLAAPRAPRASKSESPRPPTLQESLRSAVADSRSRLGTLKPWQQLIFTTEVLPLAERFVREYRPQGAGYSVDVDETMIRRYLAFSASQALGVENPKFLVHVEALRGCAPCEDAVPSLTRLLEERLRSRGIQLVWITAEELPQAAKGRSSSAGFPLLSRLRELQELKGAQGVVAMRMARPSVQDDESGMEIHIEDRRLRLQFGMQAAEYSEIHRLDFGMLESTQATSRRLLIEAFTSLGRKILDRQRLAGVSGDGFRSAEILLRVAGTRDYAQIQELKSRARERLGPDASVVERKLARGSCVLVVRTTLQGAELKARLNEMAVGSGRLLVAEVLEGEQATELEAKIE